MTAALLSLGAGLTWAWAETILQWNWYYKPRKQFWGEREWRLAILGIVTPFWVWRAWLYWS